LNLIDSGMRTAGTQTFSPLEAANVLRDYTANFFYCEHCAVHFVEDYSNCDMNRRCDRLATDADSASDQDWKEMALWLWEYHNAVSVRLLNVEADAKLKKQQNSILNRAPIGPGKATMAQEIHVLWPTMDECVACLKFDGTWNEAAVFQHLERKYW
jgi:hypothetical protein